jgi:cell shape-determining protein MreC
MATNSTGAISFFTGGDLSSNARLSIDSSGNLLFSNHVTSAPSVTLASGQYQITVYDNGSTPVLRVRYNNGSTVKVGDLTLS